MPDSVTPEASVRLYLLHLDDPQKLVDQAKVAAAEAAVDKAKDPIDRLKALAELDRARQPDMAQVEANFIAHSKAFADSESIPVSAFREMGVPADVLERAGFEIRTRRASSSAASSGRQRAPRVSPDTIKAAVSRLPKQFTLNDLADKAEGGSRQTLVKAVDELIKDGKVKKVGPSPSYKGRGRAPIVYEQT